jgi:hypothetical protein
MMEGFESESGSVPPLMDPDPRGPKTYRSGLDFVSRTLAGIKDI